MGFYSLCLCFILVIGWDADPAASPWMRGLKGFELISLGRVFNAIFLTAMGAKVR